MKIIKATLVPAGMFLSVFLGACAAESDSADVREYHGYLEFKDRATFDRVVHELAGKTAAQLDQWEAGYAPFRSAGSFYRQAIAEDAAFAESGTGGAPGAPHSDFVLAHQDMFLFDADGRMELDLPQIGDRLDLVVNRDGNVKIGRSLFHYRRSAYKQILDGDERTLARLDRIDTSSRSDGVMVYTLDDKRAGEADFTGLSNQCTGYTSGGGQRVIGEAQVATYETEDVDNLFGYGVVPICDTQAWLDAHNQNHDSIFGWNDKPTSELEMIGTVYVDAPTFSNPRSVHVVSVGTMTAISMSLFDSGWLPCASLPGSRYPVSLSGYLDFYGRDQSHCSMYGQGRDHFYTIFSGERDNAVSSFGYTADGIAAYLYQFQVSGTTPLYRLVAPDGHHFYTIYSGERDNAVSNFGFTSEGVAGYVFDSQVSGTTPLYRLADGPSGGTEHFYTIDPGERDYYINHYGFILEGIAAYVYASQAPSTTPLYRLFK